MNLHFEYCKKILGIKKNFIDESTLVIDNPKKLYKLIVTIPACKESKRLPALIESIRKTNLTHSQDTLFLFIVNNTTEADSETIEDNANTLEYLFEVCKDFPYDIFIIDRTTGENALPAKDGGVGLARKIAMDNALFLFDYKAKGKNILVCLDADCTVDHNYLTEIWESYNKLNLDAVAVAYNHNTLENPEAIVSYELYLRYYVLGLEYANSSYAFHTIGSTMSSTAEAYCKIEGMNKRKAAEDFYFMQKLAKVFEIKHLKSTCVYPSSRISHRVPFGTGKSVHKFLYEGIDNYIVYNPKCFEVLKNWLDIFNSKNLTSVEYLEEAGKISNVLQKFLINQDFENAWNNIAKNSKKTEQIQFQKKFWFDGFKTLKLIHFLRDEEFPNVNTFAGIKQMFELTDRSYNFSLNPDLDEQIKILEVIRNN